MPLESFMPGAVGYIPTVIKYLNPAKSPFYTVMVVATFLVGYCHHLLLNTNAINRDQFYAFLAPIVGIMALGLYVSVSLKSDYELSPEEHNEQIRFTRSFCISVALICMVWVGHKQSFGSREALVSYCSSLAQLFVFVIYTLLHWNKEQRPTQSNLIQLGLITAAFMVGFSYCLLKTDPNRRIPVFFLNLPAAFWILFMAWLICMAKWIKHFASIIQISVIDPRQPAEAR